ncbi:MAG: hypothetical protein LBI82_12060 [Dysgonamonadaceae bacterium]|jgi:hypothetical protein|nr:hypothetical protein [Dysgonamonadaceae bacterium]
MNQQLFYVAGLLIAMFFAYKVMSKVKDIPKKEEKKKPVKPTEEIPNDKIILVENVNREQIESVLTKFCRMYNEDEYAVLPRLIPLSESKFAIIFPFDDALEIVCYLVNYLNYPTEIEWNATIFGWATAENESSWEEEKDLLNKKVMLYCSPEKEDNSEYIEIITSEYTGYRINLNSEITKENDTEKQYIAPGFQPKDLEEKEYLDFE